MIEEEEYEKCLGDYPKIISYNKSIKIIEQMEKNICKLMLEKNAQGTGFFCKIPFPTKENMLPVFITNNHLINKDMLNTENYEIKLWIEEKKNTIKLNLDNRMKYTNVDYDTTIIELKSDDGINNYLELDDDIINNILENEDITWKDNNNKQIYIIQYPEGELSVSYGVIKNVSEDKKWSFLHKCDTKWGSSGSPVLNNDGKVIGIHQKKAYHYNHGSFLNYPIKEFIQINRNFDKNENIYEYHMNDLLLKEFNKKFNRNVNDIKINKYGLVKNYLGLNGFEQMENLIEYYKDKYNQEFLDSNFQEKIIEQLGKNICKYKIGKEQETGFFCKIPFPTKEHMLPVFITSNNLINQSILDTNGMKIELCIKEKKDKIILNLDNRMKYTNIDYNTTIIELKEKDGINNYLELDDNIVDLIVNENTNMKDYKYESIYILQNNENDSSISYGIISYLSNKKRYNFKHKCYSHIGSSGSPLLFLNNKVFAIHKLKEENYNKLFIGTFLNYPIKEFIQNNYYKLERKNTKEINEKKKSIIINTFIDEFGLIKELFGNNIFNELNKIILQYKLKYSLEEVNYSFNFDFNTKLIQDMKNNVFKIGINSYQCTGFFTKIPFPNKEKMLPVIITSDYILKKGILYNKDVKIELKMENAKDIILNLNDRMKYLNDKYEIIIIELKEEDKVKKYLELDDIIMNDILFDSGDKTDYLDSQICMIQYPEGHLSLSYGVLKNINNGNNYSLQHNCCAKEGSIGSPIINKNNKVIGISAKGDFDSDIYRGTFLNYPIKEFIQIHLK